MAKLTQSYVHGVSGTPLMGETIGVVFDKTAALFPDNDALIVREQGVRWSYGELKREVDAFAAGLIALRLEPGERVGIWSPNRWEWVVAQFATAKAGLILVNINPAYRLAEVEYALNKVACKALITAVQFKTSDYLEMVRKLVPEIDGSTPGVLGAARLPDLRIVIRLGEERTAGMYNFSEVAGLARTEHRSRLDELSSVLQVDDPINIQFTSETTGFPKGATLTHHNILNNAYFLGRRLRFTERDRLCIPVPLYHAFGMTVGNLVCINYGAAMVYTGEGFDPLAVLGAIEAERCTALHGVPTMFIAWLDHPEFKKFDLSSLRTGIMGGAPGPIELIKRVVGEMHMSGVANAFGMTETGPTTFQTEIDDSLERRVSTVGRVHPHVEAKVIDQDGRIVPPGERGEICVRGYSVMRGYWGDEDKTSDAIDAAGWMHTGDLGTLDDQGYLNIVGRAKDMVIRGGENIYPREIEEFFYRHPKIQDVQIVGVPDHKYGEELCAWVKLREGEAATVEEIQAFCKGQIAHYKIPRHIMFVDDFPMTVTGKIQKFKIREETIAKLGLMEQKTA